MKRALVVTKNGEVVLCVSVEERTNGTLRCDKQILINGDLVPEGEKDRVVRQIKEGNITPEIESYGMHMGDNGNGMVAVWADEYDAEQKKNAEIEYAALPENVRKAREERAEISRLFDRADKSLNHDTDDMNVERGYSLLGQAERRFEQWKKDYPEAAREEKKKGLLSKAEELEHRARGARLYDADGSISPEMQEERYKKLMAEAANVRDIANKL